MKIIVCLFCVGYWCWSVRTHLTEYCVVLICFTVSRPVLSYILVHGILSFFIRYFSVDDTVSGWLVRSKHTTG